MEWAARFALFRTRLNGPHLSLPLSPLHRLTPVKPLRKPNEIWICEHHSFAADRHSAFLLCCASPVNWLSHILLSATNVEPRQTAALWCLRSASYQLVFRTSYQIIATLATYYTYFYHYSDYYFSRSFPSPCNLTSLDVPERPRPL